MRPMIAALAAAVLAVGACRSAPEAARTSKAPTGVAHPVEGWDDVNYLYRDGDVYFAGQPQESALRRFADEGVAVVVNIRTPAEVESLGFDEPATVESLGMAYVSIPVGSATFSAADVDRLAEVLSQRSGPVVIHCGSANRSGGIWAAYLVRERGMDVEDAIERGRAAGLRSESMIEAARRVAGD